jgi:hypothetical protein
MPEGARASTDRQTLHETQREPQIDSPNIRRLEVVEP